MKKNIFLVCFWVFSFGLGQDFVTFRNQCKEATDKQEVAQFLVEKASSAYENSHKLEYKIYLSMGYFCLAKHYINPVKKMNNFEKGKRILDQLILKNPNFTEARFYRYALQSNIPKLLKYNTMESDKRIIIKNWSSLNDLDLKLRIKNYLKF